ncbi:hypothetical protein, partial [Vibrio cholerae]|uniref:hypothetical protein n=1 Tax=Vibrio cholerae TaxID=666 RepID=UPI001BAF9982
NDYIGKTLKPWPILVDHYKPLRHSEIGLLNGGDYALRLFPRNQLFDTPSNPSSAKLASSQLGIVHKRVIPPQSAM